MEVVEKGWKNHFENRSQPIEKSRQGLSRALSLSLSHSSVISQEFLDHYILEHIGWENHFRQLEVKPMGLMGPAQNKLTALPHHILGDQVSKWHNLSLWCSGYTPRHLSLLTATLSSMSQWIHWRPSFMAVRAQSLDSARTRFSVKLLYLLVVWLWASYST